MTDNEIIKALECCTSDRCLECPIKNIPKVSGCMALMTSALKLINRQKAEIERLKEPRMVTVVGARCMGKTRTIYRAVGDAAIKEFAQAIKEEIEEALNSNYSVRAERIENGMDEFISFLDGKITALRGIYEFIDSLAEDKITVGVNTDDNHEATP